MTEAKACHVAAEDEAKTEDKEEAENHDTGNYT